MADRDVTVAVKANTADYDSKLLRATAATKKFAAEGRTAGQSLDQIGRTAGRVGLIAAAGLGVMVIAAARFDKSMSAVRAATHETAENMDLLREAAIQAGADTAFSATEAAEGIEELAKAGVATADILGGGLSGALDLAAAGGMAVADAAEATATALQQFKLEGSQASHVADLLAAGAGKAQGSVSDMALALDYAGVPASNLGVSIEETAGAIALFSSNGIIGEKAGTSLRGMLSSLASPSKEAAKVMEDLGIHLFDNQGKFIGLAGTADQLQSKMAGLTDEERNNALGRLFSNAQLSAANILYREGGDAVESWTASVNDQGYAAETAALKMDNLAGDIEKFKGSLETALITAGEGGQGPLRKLVQGATSAVNVFGELPRPVYDSATALLAVTAITGGTLWFGSKVIRSVADTSVALENLGPAGSKARTGLGLVTKGVAGLTIGILAYNAAKDAFDIGIDDDDIRRETELIAARYGPDIQAQIEATTAAIEEQQKIREKGVSLNVFGVVELFSSGDANDANSRINGLTDSLEELRHQQQLQFIEGVRATNGLRGTTTAFFGLTEATEEATDVTGDNTGSIESNTRSLKQNVEAMRERHDRLLAAFDAETAWGQAVADARDQVKEGTKGINASTEAGQANRGVLSSMASAWNNQSDAVKNSEGRYAQARQTFINLAVELGVSRAKAKELANELLQVPKNTVAKVTVDGKQAHDMLTVLGNQLDAFESKTIILRTIHVQEGLDSGGHTPPAGGGKTGGNGGPRRVGSTSRPGVVPTTTILPTIDLTNVDIRSLRQALFDFAVAASDGANGVRSAVEELRSSLLEAGGVWTGNLELQSQKLIATAEAYDDARASLADLTQQQKQLVDAVRSAFTHDLFGNGLQGFFLQAEADTNDAATFQKVLQELKAMGLDGPAFEQLAASGDLATAQELLASGLIDEFEQAIAGREAQLSSLGAVVGQELGMAIREQTATLYTLDRQLEAQETALRKLTEAVEGIKEPIYNGAYTGTYRGTKDANEGRDARTAAGRR